MFLVILILDKKTGCQVRDERIKRKIIIKRIMERNTNVKMERM